MNEELLAVPISTETGDFLARYSARGLAGLEFPKSNRPRRTAVTRGAWLSRSVARWHRLTVQALNCALAGKPMSSMPPLDLSAGTMFQKRVWGALRRIPLGRTMTYAEVAKAIRAPGAVRAVGGACGANPIPVLIPCHRVLRTNGQLGGFTAGLKWKRLLLAREGVRLNLPAQ